MVDLSNSAQQMKNILGLSREPVAVKFHRELVNLDNFNLPRDYRYCQMLMGATQGSGLTLTADNISCPAAGWALGFKEPPSKLVSGEMPAGMGIFGSPVAAKTTLNTMTRLEMGKYKMVSACPLSMAYQEPDVVVIEATPEQLMWIALAYVFGTGGRLEFTTAILQATCVDTTIIPFITQRLNCSLGCYGCREATDLADSECMLGFPVKDLDIIVSSLVRLNEKAIPRVRGKTIYKALTSRRNT
jgi:uncharacterized protein (DUF169 family)